MKDEAFEGVAGEITAHFGGVDLEMATVDYPSGTLVFLKTDVAAPEHSHYIQMCIAAALVLKRVGRDARITINTAARMRYMKMEGFTPDVADGTVVMNVDDTGDGLKIRCDVVEVR